MFEAATEFFLPLMAAKTAPFILTGGAIVTTTLGLYTTVDTPRPPSYVQRIGNYAAMYNLTVEETERLRSVLNDYPPADVENELGQELRCIMAARKLAATPQLTSNDMQSARAAFASGRVPFVAQDVD